tara:strand:+ start:1659 stop:2990 length:1332 start_codon:yes stop_codon:yes gene_type:complete
MKLISYVIILIIQINFILCQSVPPNYYLNQSREIFYDSGKDWELLTIFGPNRFNNIKLNDITFMDGHLEAGFINKSLNGFVRFNYKNYYYGYFSPSIVTRENSDQPNNIGGMKILGLRDYQSGLGFENSWIILQICRGGESWGAGRDIELALSQQSSSYDYFLLGSDYGNIRVRYIHGFLEKIDPNINRYINARGIEWTNKKSLVIGLTETIIYSGENRSIDMGYLNPISSHLEVELNNRLNIIGDNNSNAVWQIHLDYLFQNNLRISLNYLYDEFVIDRSVQINKEHGKAFSFRLAFTPILTERQVYTLYGTLVHVGTPTFRHGDGSNNFVHNGRPLGWYKGSDSEDYTIGVNYFNRKNLTLSFSIGFLQSGEETITNRIFDSYADYLAGPFPSGIVEKYFYYETYFTLWWNQNISISKGYYWSPINKVFDLKIFYHFNYSR